MPKHLCQGTAPTPKSHAAILGITTRAGRYVVSLAYRSPHSTQRARRHGGSQRPVTTPTIHKTLAVERLSKSRCAVSLGRPRKLRRSGTCSRMPQDRRQERTPQCHGEVRTRRLRVRNSLEQLSGGSGGADAHDAREFRIVAAAKKCVTKPTLTVTTGHAPPQTQAFLHRVILPI